MRKFWTVGLCVVLLGYALVFSQERIVKWDQIKNNEPIIVKAIDELLRQNDQLRGQMMAFLDLPVSSSPGDSFNYLGSRPVGGGNYQYSFKGNRQIVTMFEHFNYGGRQIDAEVGTSVADLDTVGNSKGMEDKISSVKVQYGAQLILYQDKNFKDRSVTYVQDTPNLGDFNDKMSSYKVEGRIILQSMLWTMVRDFMEKDLKQHLKAV